ncbi:MAG: NAD-dependent epimerase/dehydratase family protein [Gemmatimonadaceae bacterium]|nr:NAD-dependent epimerase/dehydratase family protein [Gemmatimonadaceae bacterium]
MRILVTGHAGFIGFHTARALLERGDSVVGVDVVDAYYDPALKSGRLAALAAVAAGVPGSYEHLQGDLADRDVVARAFTRGPFDRVIHLAAQPGIRYSIENPHAYVQSNVVAFVNLLEACRHHGCPPLTYASTSSVYGSNRALPFHEGQGVDHPIQLYAATKRANELLAHSYSHLFGLPTTGLRFFTVYGPWGRPDMAPFLFLRRILRGEPIELYNAGHHTRDFTYVDDIVRGVILASDAVATADPVFDPSRPDPATSAAPFRVYNVGNAEPVPLVEFVDAIERATGRTAIRVLKPAQPGDVLDTHADVSRLRTATGYAPTTSVQDGVARFVEWYREFYGEEETGR